MPSLRTLYHCTETDHGETLKVRRQHPLYATREPPTPRLCVSPTVAQCLAARFFRGLKPVHVYRTRREVRGIAPVGVWDKLITGERWLIPPTVLVKSHTLDPDLVYDACLPFFARYKARGKVPTSWRERIADTLHAFRTLGEVPPRYLLWAEVRWLLDPPAPSKVIGDVS